MPLHGEYEPGTVDWARTQAESYIATAGQSAEDWKVPIVVITTVGARTGKLRKTAVVRVQHGDEYAVIASYGGRPRHPAWYFNLLAYPIVELQDGAETREYIASELADCEREAWWRRAVAAYPEYAEYQGRTEREIPVIRLQTSSERTRIVRAQHAIRT